MSIYRQFTLCLCVVVAIGWVYAFTTFTVIDWLFVVPVVCISVIMLSMLYTLSVSIEKHIEEETRKEKLERINELIEKQRRERDAGLEQKIKRDKESYEKLKELGLV